MPLSGPADIIVFGGTIHSADDALTSPQAFAIENGRFSYVGTTAGAMAYRGPATVAIDATGYTVLPGIVDSHLHLTNLGLALEQADLAGVESAGELVARAQAFAEHAPDEWILGRGWDQNLWRDKTFPVADELSAAIPDRPAALGRVDGHALLANARAMGLAGVDELTSDPPGGRIVRDARGKPTGVFIDTAQTLIYDRVPKPEHERLKRAIRAAIAECNRWGVTAVAEPGCDEAVLSAQADLLEHGEFTIRNHAMLDGDDALIEARARLGPIEAAFGGRLSVRAIKLYADGALGSRGAAMLAPYSDDPSNSGLILTPRDRIEAVTGRALRTGFQVCVHAIGDRANRMVLDAYESALEGVSPGSDPRLRVEHAQVVAREDIPRFGALGIIAAMQAPHALSDLRWAAARLGAQRIAGAYALRSMLDAGAIVANGTDAPVEPANAARTFLASISVPNREPPQCMTRREALQSMTIWAARANFQERFAGSITAGKYADFTIMDRDWMIVGLEEILSTRVVATYLAGSCVYGKMP